jgi:hypothetical protein
MTFRACSSPAPTPVKSQPALAILSQESVHTTLSITHHTRKRPSTGPRTTDGPHSVAPSGSDRCKLCSDEGMAQLGKQAGWGARVELGEAQELLLGGGGERRGELCCGGVHGARRNKEEQQRWLWLQVLVAKARVRGRGTWRGRRQAHE